MKFCNPFSKPPDIIEKSSQEQQIEVLVKTVKLGDSQSEALVGRSL